MHIYQATQPQEETQETAAVAREQGSGKKAGCGAAPQAAEATSSNRSGKVRFGLCLEAKSTHYKPTTTVLVGEKQQQWLEDIPNRRQTRCMQAAGAKAWEKEQYEQ